jgi:hypothetical protein
MYLYDSATHHPRQNKFITTMLEVELGSSVTSWFCAYSMNSASGVFVTVMGAANNVTKILR